MYKPQQRLSYRIGREERSHSFISLQITIKTYRRSMSRRRILKI